MSPLPSVVMGEKSSRTGFDIRRSTAVVIGGMAAMVCGCIGALIWILGISTTSVDGMAASGETRLLQAILKTYGGELSKTVVDYANWDEMFDNFAGPRRSAWENANLGPSVTKQLNVDYMAIAARDGSISYVYSKKRQGSMDLSAHDRARLSAIAQLAMRRPMPREGTPVLGAIHFDGTIGLVAASPVTSTSGKSPEFVLIDIRALDRAMLARISKDFGIADLHIVEGIGAGLPLQRASGGPPRSSLVWTPSREGHGLFTKVLPALIVIGVLLVIALSAALMLWRTMIEQVRTTEQRALTAEVDAARARALVAEETAAGKNAFIANMNHELRTPLNAIIGFSEIIQSEALGPIGIAKYKEYIHDIHQSGIHLLGIINDILLVSKVDAGKFEPRMEPVPVEPLMAEVVRMMEVIAAKRSIWLNTFRCHMQATVFADRQALRQVLLNVLANAVKFSPEGYGIEIEGNETADGTYEIRITDYGCGIPPETLKDVGKPFVQAETAYTRNYQGTGLGLSICFRLMAAMEGRIEVKSTVKVGTTVRLLLKTAAEQTAGADVA